jgi:hypothetical protein
MSFFQVPNWATGISGAFFSGATETLSGDKTIADADAMVLKLDPGGSARDVTLPAEGNVSAGGRFYLIVNAADAAENLVVKDDGAATIGTVGQDKIGLFYNAGLDDNGAESSWVQVFVV